MADTYEIEIKTLLGSKENADRLRAEVERQGGELIKTQKELNHYFVIKDLEKFKDELGSRIPSERRDSFQKILTNSKDISIRTREVKGEVILVMKASIGDDTSANGVARHEFEIELPMSLEELDNLLLASGLAYQAKWSREREEYKLGETHVCLDKNAGYGYLAEFERVVPEQGQTGEVKSELRRLMERFGVSELAQDRLERMFAYYNTHWQDYYGTDKVFNIE
jgi:predicted adenylyl cyclase CyaB